MDERQAIQGFLKLCIRYAEDSLARKQSRIGTSEQKPDDEDELMKWEVYRDFTEHAISEIEEGSLDSWFEHLEENDDWRPGPSDATGSTCTSVGDVSSMESVSAKNLGYEECRKFLDAIVSPRPLVLASTQSNDGVANLSGLSSLAIVSNKPPLLALSLSQDRDGRKRDTFVNIQETKKIILHVLPATIEMASIINAASKSMPSNESEWEKLNIEGVESPSTEEWPSLFPLSLAAIECELLQTHELPEEAVATLCILGIRNILARTETLDAIKDGSTLYSLCQHGYYRLTPSPNGWSYDCD